MSCIKYSELIPGEIYRGTHSSMHGNFWLFLYTPSTYRNASGDLRCHYGPAILYDDRWGKIRAKQDLWEFGTWEFSLPNEQEKLKLQQYVTEYSIY